MKEIIFLLEEDIEGGFSARALDHSIFAQAETIDELKAEKKLLWYNDSAIYHGDASKIRLAA